MTTLPLEDRKRKLRILLLGSFIFLITIWIFKLSHPKFSIIPSSSPSTPTHHHHQNPISKPSTDHIQRPTIPEPTIPFNLTARAALLIAPSFHQNLIPLLLHFHSILGPSWPLLLYTSPESVGLFSASAALTRAINLSQLQIRVLPHTVLLNSPEAVSAFLTNPWIWNSLEPAEDIFLFSSTSMICANAAVSVDDYANYTFIGAPISPSLGKGYSGSFSLRKRSAMLRVVDRWDFEQTKKGGENFEDQWFSGRLKALMEQDQVNGVEESIVLPSLEVARTFAVESVEFPHPLGVTGIGRFLGKDVVEKLVAWCPEYKLCGAG